MVPTGDREQVVGGQRGEQIGHPAPAVRRLQAAGSDTVTASVGIVSAAALVAAALWLESVCRVPPEDTDPTQGVSA